VVITVGTCDSLQNDDELAGILAYGVSCLILNVDGCTKPTDVLYAKPIRTAVRGRRIGHLQVINCNPVSDTDGQFVKAFLKAHEADERAVELMTRAGYDPLLMKHPMPWIDIQCPQPANVDSDTLYIYPFPPGHIKRAAALNSESNSLSQSYRSKAPLYFRFRISQKKGESNWRQQLKQRPV